MNKYIKTSEYAKLMGIHYRTAARHFHQGKVKGYQDETTKTIYIENPDYKSNQLNAIIYVEDKWNSLKSQVNQLTEFAISKGYNIVNIINKIDELNLAINCDDWNVLILDEYVDGISYLNLNPNQKIEILNISLEDQTILENLVHLINSFYTFSKDSKDEIRFFLEDFKMNLLKNET